ncbi:phage protein [Exiguobacterium sp. R-39]|uniref:phage protein n=1 Tax=Exiguobacterium sp. R-39 TaxID=3416708 RepID=UPI003CFAF18B
MTTERTEQFGRVKRVSFESANYKATYSNEGDNGLEIRFENPFDDDSKPNETEIEIYNLSKDSIARIKRGVKCTLQAGYKGEIGVLASGIVSRAITRRDGVNKITTVFILEGDDYSRIKVTKRTADPAEKYTSGKKKGQDKEQKLQIAFKKETKGSVIINKLIRVLGIKLAAKPKLTRDKVYKKGYVVTGLILNNLEEVVRDCGSIIYYRRGRLVIRPLREGFDERFTVSEETGLIASPEPFDDEENDGYKIKMLLQHRITVASIVKIKSSTANGTFRVIRGKHFATSDGFYTEAEVI